MELILWKQDLPATPAARNSGGLRWKPRLRRWLRKLKQYGRFELDFDLSGLLHLTRRHRLTLL